MNSAKTLFEKAFNSEPDGLGTAHGRVNLIGEHIDYHGGLVLPKGIPQCASVAVSTDHGNNLDTIYSPSFGDPVTRAFDRVADGHWSDYVAGAIQKVRALELVDGGMRVAVESEVPFGAGLSSSAAIIVAALKAILNAVDRPIDNVQISLWAQQIEHDYIGMPCGIMDQMAVAIATDKQALALDTESLNYEVVDLPEDYHFAVVHSGVTRRLEDGRYALRRTESERARDELGVSSLCLMSEQEAEKISALDPELQRRARHVYTEHHRVKSVVAALKSQDIDEIGRLMRESHASMRDDFEMSTLEIDVLVEGAIAAGALGARLTGGGFGGCIVACVPRQQLSEWRDVVASKFPNSRSVA